MHQLTGMRIAVSGMLTLAVAMGIGRFAFTPMLPIMQDEGLTLAAGGWLASANYLGYFIGALSAIWMRVPAATMVRSSLVAIACLTAAMGMIHDQTFWLGLRAAAGIASAWALIFASAWIIPRLMAAAASDLAGIVYGGVGLGVALAGVLCVLFLKLGMSSSQDWIALGVLALILTGVCWGTYGSAQHAQPVRPVAAQEATRTQNGNVDSFRLIVCYGLYGFGYIVPATFLPVMAKNAVPDPAIFGWAWPIFGLAALCSTLAAGRLSRRWSYRRIWAGSHVLMAAGVLIPALRPGIAGIALSALCVGGTFVVMTLVGMQEARRVAPARSASLMAAMTAAFAVGQIFGPVLVGFASSGPRGLDLVLVAAAVALVLSAAALFFSDDGSSQRAPAA